MTDQEEVADDLAYQLLHEVQRDITYLQVKISELACVCEKEGEKREKC